MGRGAVTDEYVFPHVTILFDFGVAVKSMDSFMSGVVSRCSCGEMERVPSCVRESRRVERLVGSWWRCCSSD